MKLVWILCCGILLWGCSEAEEKEEVKKEAPEAQVKQEDKPVNPEDLIEVVGTTYKEYYDAAKTKIKFEGEQDEEKRRHGKWVYYFENGTEGSITFYKHGKPHGFSQVKRPNGAMYYHGEYNEGEKVGVWKNYDEKGQLVNEINYDEL